MENIYNAVMIGKFISLATYINKNERMLVNYFPILSQKRILE